MKAHKKPKEFLQRKKELMKKRGNFSTLWESCAKHILPDRAEFLTSKTVGDENVSIFDTTAIDANFVLAGWIWSQMTNPSTHWFKCRVKNKLKREIWSVKEWFRLINDIMYDSFANSNFYDSMNSFYLVMGAIGTAPMFMNINRKEFKLQFTEITVRDTLLSENQGVVDTMYRTFKWSVRVMAAEWGEENLSKKAKELIADKKYDEELSILHIVEPYSDYNKDSLRGDEKPFRSVYMEEKEEHILEVGGYDVFPYVIGRFYRWSDSVYGRSPGMLALPDIRTADDQDKTNLRAGHKAVMPPLNIPGDMKGRVRTTPNALNFMGKSGEGITPIDTGLKGLPHAKDALERKQQKIEDKFFKRIILMLDSSGNVYKNIPEIMAREQEKMSVIGAPIGRLMHQVLGPIIEWAFLEHLKAGRFPEPPNELIDEEIDVEYTSPLAMTQKQLEVSSISRAMEMSVPAIQLNEEAKDNINTDKYIQKIFNVYGAEEVLNSPEEIEDTRLQRQQAQQEQMEQQQLAEGIQAAKTAVETGKGVAEIEEMI